MSITSKRIMGMHARVSHHYDPVEVPTYPRDRSRTFGKAPLAIRRKSMISSANTKRRGKVKITLATVNLP